MRMNGKIFAAALVLGLGLCAFAQEGALRPWQPVGPGGGGGNFRAVVSPHEAELYFAACDMGGFYRSDDAGGHWEMIPGISHTTTPALFHPDEPGTVYVAHMIGAFLNRGWAISKSEDRGETWKRIYGFIGAYATNSVTCLAVNPENPSEMLAGTSGPKPGRILRSQIGGHHWKVSDEGIPSETEVLEIYFTAPNKASAREGEPFIPGGKICAVTRAGVFLSVDGGRTWSPSPGGLPEGASPVACAEAGGRIYVATGIEESGGSLKGGLFRSDDGGASWRQSGDPVAQVFEESGGRRAGELRAVAAAGDPEIVYAAARIEGSPVRSGIWKSTDGGETWRYVLMGDDAENLLGPRRGEGSDVETGWLTREFSWWWGDIPITRDQLSVCEADSDIVLRQDYGRTIGSRDGGETWRQLYTDHVEGNRWTSRGYEVTTCYRVYWNPADHDKMFIAYTDIGFFRSEDGGESWIYSLHGARHRNTVYDLAVDPDDPSRMWAATSGSHDQPYWKTLVPDRDYSKGTVAMSRDGGKSWTNLDSGLPNASCGRVVLDPESPPESRTLYVTSWGQGVYKSTDGGRSWERKVDGIDVENDYNFWRMSQALDGTLYLITTKTIEPREGGGYDFGSGALYRSEDGAESWQRVAKGDWMAYPWDVVCDPRDPDTLYVATKDDPHVASPYVTEGGVYRSVDRGETWERILENIAPQRITVDEENADIIYVGTEYDGVYRTSDGGRVWNRLKGIPFTNCFAVSIDPDDPETVFVTTFGGGVWKGSACGAPEACPNR